MAKINNYRQDHTLPQIAGAFIIKSWRGKLYAQAWPKKRSKKVKDVTKSQNIRFANMNLIAKYAAAPIQIAALELGSKGPLYPRDYILSTMQGGIYEIVRDDGITVYSMSQVQAMSKELDIIAQLPGFMMARGEFIWEPVIPTEDGQLLYWPDKDKVPVPISNGPEIGGHNMTSLPFSGIGTNAKATKGIYFVALRDMTVRSMWPLIQEQVGGTYNCSIVELSGSTISAILGTTATFGGGLLQTVRRERLFTSSLRLEAGKKYAAVSTRTDGGPTTPLNIYFGLRQTYCGIPCDSTMGFIEFTQNVLAVSQVASNSGFGNYYTQDFMFKF